MGNIRAKVKGSGSAEPNFSGSINDANVVGRIYHTPGWQNGAAWRVPTVTAEGTAGPNIASIHNGIPVWDDASKEFVMAEGRFSFTEFCDVNDIGAEDREYLRYKLETAADGARQDPYRDHVYVNCCPQWNPFIVLCKTDTKRLLVRGGKLLLRVRHAFQAVNDLESISGLRVSATAIPSPGTLSHYDHTLSVAFRRPYGLTAQGGTDWVDYENFDKENAGWKYFVTGERVGADGIETFCTVAQLGEELNAIGELDEQRCTAEKTEASAQDPVAWLQAQPIFNSREDLQELVHPLSRRLAQPGVADCYRFLFHTLILSLQRYDYIPFKVWKSRIKSPTSKDFWNITPSNKEKIVLPAKINVRFTVVAQKKFHNSAKRIYLSEIKRVRRITPFSGNELATVLIP